MKKQRIGLTILLTAIVICIVACLTLTACKDNSSVIVPPSDKDNPSGQSNVELLDTSNFFQVIGQAVTFLQTSGIDEDEDYVVLHMKSDELSVTSNGNRLDYYIELKLRYFVKGETDKEKNENSMLSFEFRKSDSELIFGAYYDNSIFYFDIGGDKGTEFYIDELSLARLVSAVESLKGPIGSIADLGDKLADLKINMGIEIDVGGMVIDLLKSLISDARIVTEVVEDGGTTTTYKTFSVDFDINTFLNGVLSKVKGLWDIVTGVVGDIDSVLVELCGMTFTDICAYPFKTINFGFDIKTKNGVFDKIATDVSYGEDVFALGLGLGSVYVGSNLQNVSFDLPDFSKYQEFSVTNLDVSASLKVSNGSLKTVTVGDLAGTLIAGILNINDIGNLNNTVLELGVGEVALNLRAQTKLDLNHNENNKVLVLVGTKTADDILRLSYEGKDEELVIDLSPLGLPSFKYKMNLNDFLMPLLGETLTGLLSDTATAEEIEDVLIDLYGGENRDEALRNYLLNNTFNLAPAGETDILGMIKNNIIPLVVEILRSLNASSETKTLTLEINRTTLIDILDTVSGLMGESGEFIKAISKAMSEKAYSEDSLVFRSLTLTLGLILEPEQVGINADISVKLAEDTFVSVSLPLVGLGFEPEFVEVDLEDDLVDLDELSEISLGLSVDLDFDTGDVDYSNGGVNIEINKALGSLRDYLAELACVLKFEDRIQQGVTVNISANIGFDGFSLTDVINNKGFNLNITDLDLALEVLNKNTKEEILSVYYTKYADDKSALFINLENLGIEGMNAPKIKYDIDLVSMINDVLEGMTGGQDPAPSPEPEPTPDPTPAPSDPTDPEAPTTALDVRQILDLVGSVVGKISINDGLSAYVATDVLDALATVLVGEDVRDMIKVDPESKITVSNENGLNVGLELGLVTSDTHEGNLKVSLNIRDIFFNVGKTDMPVFNYDEYSNITDIQEISLSAEVYVRYDLKSNSYDVSDLLSITDYIDLGEYAKLLNDLFLNIDIAGLGGKNVQGDILVRFGANVSLANGLDLKKIISSLDAKVELIREDETLLSIYFDGVYLYVDAQMGKVEGTEVSGFDIESFKIKVGSLSCGCKCDHCIAVGICSTSPSSCGEDCECTCCTVVGAED